MLSWELPNKWHTNNSKTIGPSKSTISLSIPHDKILKQQQTFGKKPEPQILNSSLKIMKDPFIDLQRILSVSQNKLPALDWNKNVDGAW